MYIRITKEFKFEMAHALLNYDGPCKNIHGHSYMLSVTLVGTPLQNSSLPTLGMVADFSDIKQIVNEQIIKRFDHALVLNIDTPKSVYSGFKDQNLILLDFQPTCENLLIHFANTLKKALPENPALHHLLLRETNTAYAEWYAEDDK